MKNKNEVDKKEKITLLILLISILILALSPFSFAPSWFTSSATLNETGASFVNTSYNEGGWVELNQTEYKGYPYNTQKLIERFKNN